MCTTHTTRRAARSCGVCKDARRETITPPPPTCIELHLCHAMGWVGEAISHLRRTSSRPFRVAAPDLGCNETIGVEHELHQCSTGALCRCPKWGGTCPTDHGLRFARRSCRVVHIMCTTHTMWHAAWSRGVCKGARRETITPPPPTCIELHLWHAMGWVGETISHLHRTSSRPFWWQHHIWAATRRLVSNTKYTDAPNRPKLVLCVTGALSRYPKWGGTCPTDHGLRFAK